MMEGLLSSARHQLEDDLMLHPMDPFIDVNLAVTDEPNDFFGAT